MYKNTKELTVLLLNTDSKSEEKVTTTIFRTVHSFHDKFMNFMQVVRDRPMMDFLQHSGNRQQVEYTGSRDEIKTGLIKLIESNYDMAIVDGSLMSDIFRMNHQLLLNNIDCYFDTPPLIAMLEIAKVCFVKYESFGVFDEKYKSFLHENIGRNSDNIVASIENVIMEYRNYKMVHSTAF